MSHSLISTYHNGWRVQNEIHVINFKSSRACMYHACSINTLQLISCFESLLAWIWRKTPWILLFLSDKITCKTVFISLTSLYTVKGLTTTWTNGMFVNLIFVFWPRATYTASTCFQRKKSFRKDNRFILRVYICYL